MNAKGQHNFCDLKLIMDFMHYLHNMHEKKHTRLVMSLHTYTIQVENCWINFNEI